MTSTNRVVANALMSLEELLKKQGLSRAEFDKMMKEMKDKGASAVHYMRGKDGRLLFKADGTTIGNASTSVVTEKAVNAKFKVGDKVKVYHGTQEGKVLSVKEGMRGFYYEVQLGTLHGVPFVSMFEEKELLAANSSACNAKFKKGDRVKYVGSKHGAPYGKVLTIVKEPDNFGRYTIHWDSDHSGFMAVGSDGFAYEDELVLANAALNAKFKVGDKVQRGNQIGVVKDIEKEPYIEVKFKDEPITLFVHERELKISNSSATNAKFKVGDKVRIIGGGVETIAKVYPKGRGTGFGPREIDYYATREGGGFITDDDISGVAKSSTRNAMVQKALNAGNYSEKQIIDAAMQTLESRLRSVPMPGYTGPTRDYLKLIYKPNTTPQGSFSGEISAEANITEETTFDEAKAGKFGVVVYTSLGRLAPRTKIFGSINEAVAFIKGQVMPKAAKFLSEGQAKRQSDMAAKRKEDSSRRAYEKYGAVSYSNSCACNSTNPIVRKAMNSAALNFSPGDKVSIVDTDIRYGGDEGEVVRKDGFRYVVRLTSRLDKPEVTLQPNQLKAANAVAYTNPETSDKVVIKPFAGLWDVRVVPPYFHNLFTAKTKDEAVAWAKANGKTITKIENAVAKNATDHTGRTIKVGDRVTDVLDSDSRAYPLSFGVKVTKVLGDKVEITDKYGNRYTEDGYNLEIVGNAVVTKALNAVAKNSVSSDKIDQADIKILRDGGMSETDIVEAVRLWPMKEAKWGGLKTLAQFVSGSKAKDLLLRHHEWAQSAYEVNSSDTSLIDRTFGVKSTKTGKTTIGFKDPKTNLEVVVTKGPMWWMIRRSDGKKMKSVQNPAEWARKRFV